MAPLVGYLHLFDRVWRELLFTCIDCQEFRLAQVCGLNLILYADEMEVSKHLANLMSSTKWTFPVSYSVFYLSSTAPPRM